MPQSCASAVIAALENIQRRGLPSKVVFDTTVCMTTNQRLQKWLEAAKMTQAEMARRVDYDRSNFYRVLQGTIRPSLNLAARIEDVTGGAIPAIDWAEQPPADRPATDASEARAA